MARFFISVRSSQEVQYRAPMAEQTESSISISATPAQIMDVIADLSAYPQWSDGITSVTVLSRYDSGNGTTTVHYRLQVDVKIPMIGMLKRKAEKVIVDTALKGLKARVESGSGSAL